MWLVGVVVRRYIDILTIIINFPYIPCISSFFGSSIPTSLFIFKKCFCSLQYTMEALKCKPSAQFAYYTINVLSKCSNIISHRSLVFEGRHNDHRSSKVDTTTINLRRSTHRSSIFEGRQIDHRSSKVDTSIFEDRRRKHRTDNPTSHRHSNNSSLSIVHQGAP